MSDQATLTQAIRDLEDEVFRRMIEVDYFGTLHAIRAVAPGMVDRGRGPIVEAIEKKRFAVYPDRGMALLGGLGPLFAPVVRRMVDRKVRSVR